jgi:hypothetical protein
MKHLPLLIGFAVVLCLSPAFGQRQTSTSIEIEDLMNSAKVSAGPTSRQNMQGFGPGWSGNAQLFWRAPAPVDKPIRNWPHLAVWFTPPSANTFEVILHYTSAPDFGTFRVFLDGQPRADVDAYSTSVTTGDRSLGQHKLDPGKHELLVTVFTKAGASKGFAVGLDRVELRPVVATEERHSGVPVLRLDLDADARSATTAIIEPLTMAARLSIVQRATSLPLNGAGVPVRLTASSPRLPQRADLKLANGNFSPDALTDGWIGLSASGRLTLSYFQAEVQQPQLLECGVKLDTAADIRILPYSKGGTGMHPLPGGSKVSLPAGDQRLLAVLVPEKTSFSVLIEPASGVPFTVKYCELTPFK